MAIIVRRWKGDVLIARVLGMHTRVGAYVATKGMSFALSTVERLSTVLVPVRHIAVLVPIEE